MDIIQAFKARVSAGYGAFRFGRFNGGNGASGAWGGGWGTLSGATFDYRREAGVLWENSIVMGSVAWAMRNFPRARVLVERPTGTTLEHGEQEFVEVADHPFTELWNRPNPFYSRSTLWKGMILSRMVDGNSYVRINRNRFTKLPAELYYVPHFMISPRWGDSTPTFAESTNYLDRWEYRVDGKDEAWNPNDVLHWREGIDPQNPRRGISPLVSVLREISADNCASTMASALLRNNNVPGLIVSARMTNDGRSSFEGLTPEQEEKIRAMGRQKWTADRAGELAIFPAPVEVSRMSFSPKDMDLSSLRDVNEERILAQWGIPLAVAGFGAGLDQTKVGATMRAMIGLAWDQCLIPMQDDLAEEMTFWGKREFAPWFQDGERVRFDRSKIPALQEDVDEIHNRVRQDWQAGLIKRGEARRIFGMSAGQEDEIFFGEGQQPTAPYVELADIRFEDEEDDAPQAVKARRPIRGPHGRFVGSEGDGSSDLNEHGYPHTIAYNDSWRIAPEKITEYLLKPLEKNDKSKNFVMLGFSRERPEEFETAIRQACAGRAATFATLKGDKGSSYQMPITLSGPNGKSRNMTLIWHAQPPPLDQKHLVTAVDFGRSE